MSVGKPIGEPGTVKGIAPGSDPVTAGVGQGNLPLTTNCYTTGIGPYMAGWATEPTTSKQNPDIKTQAVKRKPNAKKLKANLKS